MMFGASQSVPSSEIVASADDQTTAAASDSDAEPIDADVPLPPHRPRRLGRTITANR